MLEHLTPSPQKPRRVVVVGAGGFVGKAIAERVARDGVEVVRVARAEVDLLAPDASEKLAGMLRAGDSFVAVSAIAPCKNAAMLKDNIVLSIALTQAAAAVDLAHVVNVSSDAVFMDLTVPMTEATPKAPESFHGVMHLAREIMFQNSGKAPLAILRPTLIYGAGDPHNGYGPNQFRRKANRGEPIKLFGEGEERRDHVSVDDVAELTARVLWRRSKGSLNVATGTVTSFRDIAAMAVGLSGRAVAVTGSPRQGPMPHNGYRAFDPAATHAAFPDFAYTTLSDGLARAQKAEFPDA
jgi:nucleoside-diphosphate-sugar epimerase